MRSTRLKPVILVSTVALFTTGLLALASPAMADGTTPAGLDYTLSGPNATITGYTPGALAVTIPDTIVEGGTPYTVTEIGPSAFASKGLISVVIPSSVTKISNSAFYDNALTTVTIPTSVTTIGGTAFQKNALDTLTIPNSVSTISGSAFYDNKLTSVTIPDSVTTIGAYAFYRNKLTTVTIPDSVTSIYNYAFDDNPILSSVVFNGDVPGIVGTTPFDVTLTPIVFYFHVATGFTNPWTSDNYPTQKINAKWSTLALAPGGPVLANGAATYTATLTVMSDGPSDTPAGAPVVGFPAAFTIPAGVTASASGCITDAAGQCTFTLTSTTAGTYTIGALAGAEPDDPSADAIFSAVPTIAATGAETGSAPYVAGGALLTLGLFLMVYAARRRKAVA